MNWWLQPFYKVSNVLLSYLPEKVWKKKAEETRQRMRRLFPSNGMVDIQEYYAKRMAPVLTVLFWGIGLVLAGAVFLSPREETRRQYSLERPSYGEGNKETELYVAMEGQEKETEIPIHISERVYTSKEIQKVFGEIMEEMDQVILGNNQSLDEVREDLSLPSTLHNGTVNIQWIVSPTEFMDTQGKILKEVQEEGEVVELRALLSYREHQAEYTCFAHLYPPIRSREEELFVHLKNQIIQADRAGENEGTLVLPDQVDGKKVSFYKPKENIPGILLLLVAFGLVFLWVRQEEKLKEREKEREKQLTLDYPELLFKLSMLLGAGLTLKAAFGKIASEYEKTRRKKERFVYEEMMVTCREMENGKGEAAAYEEFGRRCGQSAYIKLGSVLSQNLKKGGNGLQEILEKEAEAGFEERKNLARKLGEEAGTKLLLPMILMLVIVLVILMVPALMSF